ncbi:MAG: hypothetical protein ACI9GH_000440 [Candidatus Paceibacteria bacterium]|jgi:hypothetical protein
MDKTVHIIATAIFAIPVIGLTVFSFTAFGESDGISSFTKEEIVEEVEARKEELKIKYKESEVVEDRKAEKVKSSHTDTLTKDSVKEVVEVESSYTDENTITSTDDSLSDKYQFITKYNTETEDLKERYLEGYLEKYNEEPRESLEKTFTPHTEVNVRLNEDVGEISKNVNTIKKESIKAKDEVKKEINRKFTETIKVETEDSDSDDEDNHVTEKIDIVFSEKTKKEVSDIEKNITKNIEERLKYRDVVSDVNLEKLKLSIEAMFDEIEAKIEEETGKDVDLTERRLKVQEKLNDLSERIESKKDIIADRGGELLLEDTDGDGLSDYDEVYIYKTDPDKAYTKGDRLNDREKIVLGINPTSDNEERINFENPKEDNTSVISELHTVTEVKLISSDAMEGKNKVAFSGKALPNSLVTLYIFSTPVVVTIKADENGEWEYTLDKELEDGEHEVFVATVDNTGKIVARSNAIPFVKTAEAATINVLGNDIEIPVQDPNFLKDNIISIVMTILVIAFIGILIILGRKHKLPEELNNVV